MKLLIIYLIEINEPRRQDGMKTARLIDETLNAHLVIATTKWGDRASVEETWERALSEAYPCKVHRFLNTQDSAWAIAYSSSRSPLVKLSDFSNKLAAVQLPAQMIRGFFRGLFSRRS